MSFKFFGKSFFSFFKIYSLPLLSAVLLGTSYIPFPPLSLLFAWVPLWYFIFTQKSLKRVLIGAWICQFLSTLIGFNWLVYTIHFFGDMPWFISVLGLMIFCAFFNIYMVVAVVMWFIFTKKLSQNQIVFKLLLFPIFYSVFHTLIPMLFPWNFGYPWFWIGLPAFQTAELWGFRFLNTLTYLFNLFFLVIFKHQEFYRKGSFWKLPLFKYRLDRVGQKTLMGALGLFIILNVWGFYLKRRLAPPDKELKVLIVQHNIGQTRNLKLERTFRNIQAQVYFYLKEMTYKGLIKYRREYKNSEDIDFILWPEGAYPYVIPKNSSRVRKASSLAQKVGIPLITGGVGRDEKDYSNSLFVLSREGKLLKPVYDKSILLAFGEYMPGIFALPFVKRFFPYFQGKFTPGTEQGVLNLEGVRLGFQICYESLFDSHGRNLAQKEPQVFLNITNDSWYGSWQEPWQHLYLSLARAVEVRRPFIRGTNTGFSTVIKADGTVMERSPFNKKWVHLYTVPYRRKMKDTLFMSWGFYINEMFLLLLTLFGLFWFERKKEEGQ